jgi:hypothetical protein
MGGGARVRSWEGSGEVRRKKERGPAPPCMLSESRQAAWRDSTESHQGM